MSLEIDSTVCIKFIGIGDSGIGVISRMVQTGTQGMDFIAIHTDNQVLSASDAPTRIQMREIEESCGAVTKALAGADMVFIWLIVKSN